MMLLLALGLVEGSNTMLLLVLGLAGGSNTMLLLTLGLAGGSNTMLLFVLGLRGGLDTMLLLVLDSGVGICGKTPGGFYGLSGALDTSSATWKKFFRTLETV